MQEPIAFIDSVKWKFATSMRHIPHWYIVKDKVDPEKFMELVEHVRVYGRLGIWAESRLDWYLHIRNHGFYYWTMGATIAETEVINRAEIATDSVHYLDSTTMFSTEGREMLEKWAEEKECPYCRSLDPFATQWAGPTLVGVFCSNCRRRFL